jgi:hypothetical protein
MSDRKSAKPNVVRRVRKLLQNAAKSLVTMFLRAAFVMNRRSRLAATGFVLPTVVLLVLVVTLTTGALVFRAFNSSSTTIASNQNRVIYNAATPAIDRARSKLEYLFDASKDTRFPSGVPAEQFLMSMLLNNGATVKGRAAPALLKGGTDPVLNDPYTLPGETRIDMNGDGANFRDNAWTYRADTDGNGTADATVAYSIIFSTPPDEIVSPGTQPIKGAQRLVGLTDQQKVEGTIFPDPSGRRISYARSGPISNAAGLSCGTGGGSRDGWYADRTSTSTLRKNFQIDAIVIPDRGAGGVTTLELQQDRQLDSGNKWGAWFRNDLELNPGQTFQWNGAMHTEGSFLVGMGNFTAHLISSPASCLFEPTASQISVTVRPPVAGSTDPEEARGFRGLVMAGSVANDNINGNAPIYIHSNNPQAVNLTPDTDWVNSTARPFNVILNPTILQTRNLNRAASGNGDNLDQRQNNLYDSPNTNFQGRFRQQTEPSPYVDDTYRADNRYGPKPRYDNQITIPATKNAGDPILSGDAFNGGKTGLDLTRTDPPTGSTTSDNVGLDGYWERRARLEGLRILVSERLELGNPFGWGGSPATPNPSTDYSINTDPLYPPVHPTATPGSTTETTLRHEIQQNRALRDNLAAVQAAAIYHAGVGADRDQPAACLISTAHPGTPQTLANSIDFTNPTTTAATAPYIDFFSGRGTNGWEFAPPSQTDVTTGTLRTALLNLAQFAGDHINDTRTGAFPPTQEANIPHPYPLFTMWGNFSNLRRTLLSGAAYADLSPADKSYLYTAGCMVGALAYSTDQISSFPLTANRTALDAVATRLEEIIRKSATPSDYINAPVERLFAELDDPTRVVLATGQTLTTISTPPTAAQRIDTEIARRFAARAQILRDRAFGFRPSPVVPLTVGGATLQVADLAATAVPTDPYSADRAFFTSSTLSAPQQAALRKLYGNYVPANGVTGAPAGIQPEYPALYYIFPSTAHGQTGSATTVPTTAQPASEPYIADAYVTTANPSTTNYAVVEPSAVDLTPRALNGSDWVLPYTTTISDTTRYRNTNFIRVPNGATSARVAVGFLDRVLYNGRERLPARVMDLDLGLLRLTAPRGVATDAWLPKSGIIYAFREDAMREDAIARPAGVTPNNINTRAFTLRALNAVNPFASQTDPLLGPQRLSTKAVDYVADPVRRVHGFRLRDGSRLRRLVGTTAQENTRGLSLFTDDPVYVMGDLNLHEEVNTTTPVEEFTERLWNYTSGDEPYTATTFYGRRSVDGRFAAAANDEWRPTEILSDAASVISDTFCDGSVLDGFWVPGQTNGAQLTTGRRGLYNSTTTGLYGRGCSLTSNVRTSFLNQNRPRFDAGGNSALDPTGATEAWGPLLPPSTARRTWLRENPYDPNSPIRFSRNGLPLLVDANATTLTTGSRSQAGLAPSALTDAASGYYNIANGGVEDRPLQKAEDPGARVNAILISGQVPQRQNQGNGGLHNFPRFLEDWGGDRRLWFSGSMLQLNFSNYASANFDSDAWEPSDAINAGERISYYAPPRRFWGYDVGLQLAPSSPAAARFVTPSSTRNEFYTELPINDAYVTALCRSAPTPAGVRKPC